MKVISHKELAAAYGVHTTTLTRWIKQLRFIKTGKKHTVYTPQEQTTIFNQLGSPFLN